MKNPKRSIQTLAALLVFAVFAVGILLVLLEGGGAYRRLTRRDREAYESRTVSAYLTTRVRQAPEPAVVTVAPFGDSQALVLPQTIDGQSYATRVYCYEGWLMELFARQDGGFSPEDGEKLLPLKALTFRLEDGLLTADFTEEDGGSQTLWLQLRGVTP